MHLPRAQFNQLRTGVFFGMSLLITLGYLATEPQWAYRGIVFLFSLVLAFQAIQTYNLRYVQAFALFLLGTVFFFTLENYPLLLITSGALGVSLVLTIFSPETANTRTAAATSVFFILLLVLLTSFTSASPYLKSALAMVGSLALQELTRLTPKERWSALAPYAILILLFGLVLAISLLISRS